MFENKLVAVMNGKIDTGVVMNALAHMSIGFGAKIGEAPLRLTDFTDGDGQVHPDISEMPFMILKAKNSNKVRALKEAAAQEGITCVDFIDTMTQGTYTEQLERTRNTSGEELTYYGILLFGPWDAVSALTKKFSLWK